MNEQSLWSRGKLQQVPNCPACGSGHHVPRKFERQDNDGQLSDKWRMIVCQDCSSIWLNPRPDAASLPLAYESYYTHNEDIESPPTTGTGGLIWQFIHGYLNRRFGMHRQPANRLGHLIFSCLEPWRLKLDYYGRHLTRCRFPTPGLLLDVGCGNGSFLARAAEMGWQVVGCEPDPKAAEVCRDLGCRVLDGDAFNPGLDNHQFDVITLSHVIEHVEDQRALLRRLFSLLKPNGQLWLALPNPESIGFRAFGEAWSVLHPPFHLCIPSQTIVVSLLADAGFENIGFRRRGSHIRRIWDISQNIAIRDASSVPSRFRFGLLRIKAHLHAIFSTRAAEETVVTATKPKGMNNV